MKWAKVSDYCISSGRYLITRYVVGDADVFMVLEKRKGGFVDVFRGATADEGREYVREQTEKRDGRSSDSKAAG